MVAASPGSGRVVLSGGPGIARPHPRFERHRRGRPPRRCSRPGPPTTGRPAVPGVADVGGRWDRAAQANVRVVAMRLRGRAPAVRWAGAAGPRLFSFRARDELTLRCFDANAGTPQTHPCALSPPHVPAELALLPAGDADPTPNTRLGLTSSLTYKSLCSEQSGTRSEARMSPSIAAIRSIRSDPARDLGSVHVRGHLGQGQPQPGGHVGRLYPSNESPHSLGEC